MQFDWPLTRKNLDFIKHHQRIQMGCGSEDSDHLRTVREFHGELTALGVPHDYFEVRGLAHNQKEMIAGRKNAWFDSHVESLGQNGAHLHYLK